MTLHEGVVTSAASMHDAVAADTHMITFDHFFNENRFKTIFSLKTKQNNYHQIFVHLKSTPFFCKCILKKLTQKEGLFSVRGRKV